MLPARLSHGRQQLEKRSLFERVKRRVGAHPHEARMFNAKGEYKGGHRCAEGVLPSCTRTLEHEVWGYGALR
jgi:hypothetical protein